MAPILRLIIPSVIDAWNVNSGISDCNPQRASRLHAQRLKSYARDETSELLSTLSIIYQTSQGRISALETKAVGLLQVLAIMAVGLVVLFERLPEEALLSQIAFIGATIYICSATVDIIAVLWPRPRRQLLLEDAYSEDAGLTDLAVAIECLSPVNVRLANWLGAGVDDAVSAGIWIVLTVALVASGM